MFLICADCRQHGFHFHRLPFPGLELAVSNAAKLNMRTLFLTCADCRQHGFHVHRLPFPGLEPAVGGAAPARRLSAQSEGLQERPPAVQERPGGLSVDAQHEGIDSLVLPKVCS